MTEPEPTRAAAGTGPKLKVGPNGWAVLCGSFVMFAMATETQSVWMQALACGLVGMFAVSVASVFVTGRGTDIELTSAADVVVGEPFETVLRVRNRGWRGSQQSLIRHSFTSKPGLTGAVTFYVEAVAPGDQVAVSVTLTPTARGAAAGRLLCIRRTGAFGLVWLHTHRVIAHATFSAPAQVRPLRLATTSGTDSAGRGVLGPGLEVRGVREWRPGDAARHVHWRSTARTGRLAVLEYGEPTIGSVGVIVAGTAGEPKFEAAVAIAASTARQAMDDGVRVFVAVDAAGESRIEPLTPQSWHRYFASVGAVVVGPPATIDTLLEILGQGGILIAAVGSGVPQGWRGYLETAATAVGVRVIDVVEQAARVE